MTGRCNQCGGPCDHRVLRCRACWRKDDKPSGVLIPLIDRFSLDANGCWNWKGSKNSNGYGEAHYQDKRILAHRLAAHLWLRMPLADKRFVLHRCDNPACFNPKHLFFGTQSDNMQDCAKKLRHGMLRRTHCPKGHPYNEQNTHLYQGRRFCRTCKRLSGNVARDLRRKRIHTQSKSCHP